MAGIMANSASQTMVSGDTSADNAVSDYVEDEQITLTVTPSGTDYEWSQTIPAGSAPSVSGLSAETGASITFTPDIGGTFLVTCIVDSTTTYVLRITVLAITVASNVNVVNHSPFADTSVPAPALGERVYYSSTATALGAKTTGNVFRPFQFQGVDVVIGTTRIINTASPYTLLATDATLYCDTDGGAITVLLPAGTAGRYYRIINTGSSANDVTITPNGAELLNGSNGNDTLADGASLEIAYETTEGWW